MRSKAAGDAAVRDAVPSATIFRPAPIVGEEDDFFNNLLGQVGNPGCCCELGGVLAGHGCATSLMPCMAPFIAAFFASARGGGGVRSPQRRANPMPTRNFHHAAEEQRGGADD